MKFVVTHYSKRTPDTKNDLWVTLPIVTRKLGEINGPYYFGYETFMHFSAEEIYEQENVGSLKRLPRPYTLASDKALWLTPEMDVFIASSTDPFKDSEKILVDADLLLNSPDDHTSKPTVNDKVRNEIHKRNPKSLVVVDGEYLSRPLYSDLVMNIINKLLKVSNATAVSTIPKGDWRLENLPTYMEELVFDFCKDPYFQTEARRSIASVVQFGRLKSFTLVHNNHGINSVGYLKDESKPFGERLIDFLTHTEFEVEILGGTAAAMEVMHYARRSPALLRRIKTQPDVITLRFRLQEKYQERIAIVDIGIARQIVTMKKETIKEHYPNSLEWDSDKVLFAVSETKFNFREEIPVGFLFQRSCSAWGLSIKNAFAEALIELWEKVPWESSKESSASVTNELATIGVEAFSLQELCENFGLSEKYFELHVTYLKSRLEKALRGDDNNELSMCKAEYDDFLKGAS